MKWYWWVALGFIGVGYLLKDKAMEIWDDAVTKKRIAELHPAMQPRVIAFIAAAEKRLGILLRAVSTYRSFEEQQDLYDQGRTKPGKIVTNAKPGSSFHNYRLAVDLVEMKNGVALWDNPNWKKIGALGKEFGLEWGGDWTSFTDLPHFQYPPGKKASDLLAMKNAGKVDAQGNLNIA